MITLSKKRINFIAFVCFIAISTIFTSYPHFDVLGVIGLANNNIASGSSPFIHEWIHRPVIFNFLIYLPSLVTSWLSRSLLSPEHMIILGACYSIILYMILVRNHLMKSFLQDDSDFRPMLCALGSFILIPSPLLFQPEFTSSLLAIALCSSYNQTTKAKYILIPLLTFLVIAVKYVTFPLVFQSIGAFFILRSRFPTKKDLVATALGFSLVLIFLIVHPHELDDLKLSIYAQHVSPSFVKILTYAKQAFLAFPYLISTIPISIIVVAKAIQELISSKTDSQRNSYKKYIAYSLLWTPGIAVFALQKIGSIHHLGGFLFPLYVTLTLWLKENDFSSSKNFKVLLTFPTMIGLSFIIRQYSISLQSLTFLIGTFAFSTSLIQQKVRSTIIITGLLVFTGAKEINNKLNKSIWWYEKSKITSKKLKKIRPRDILFLGSAHTIWLASGHKSACRHTLPLAVQRSKINSRRKKIKGTKAYNELHTCILNYNGSVIVKSKYFQDTPLSEQVNLKLKNKYKKVFHDQSGLIEIYEKSSL